MGKLMEMFSRGPQKQLDLDIQRTKLEIAESIRNKNKKGLPLDKEELALIEEEKEDDKIEEEKLYGEHKHIPGH